jgi:hypothetical protein
MRLLFCICSILAFTSAITFESAFGLPSEVNRAGKKDRFHNPENENAYYIYTKFQMEVINENSDRKPNEFKSSAFSSKMAFHYNSRMKLNTKSAIQKYAYISLDKASRTTIRSFDITTYKQDGTKIKLDSSQIFHSMLPDQSDTNKKYDLMKYVIPGIEPGDEIEIDYSFEFEGDIASKLSGNIFFNTELPALKWSYEFIVPYPYRVFYKCYNGLKEPKIEISDNKAICTFSLDSCFAVTDLSLASLYNDVPYFYYSIEYAKNLNQSTHWKDLYNKFLVFSEAPIYYLDQFDTEYYKWLKLNLKPFKEEDKYKQFEVIYNLIREKFEDKSNEKESSILGYYSRDPFREDNNFRVCKPYAKLLNYLGIDYYVCFARNKYNGKIDEDFIRNDEITDVLMMYYDNDSNLVMVYPNDYDHSYYLNEIPGYLSGTDAMMIKILNNQASKNKKKDTWIVSDSSLTIKKISLLEGNETVNFFYRLRNVGISKNSPSASYFSKINLSGYTSTDQRLMYKVAFQDKEFYKEYLATMEKDTDIFKVDSIYKKTEGHKYPFKFSVCLAGKLNKLYNYVNDSTIIISVDEMLTNKLIDYDRQSRNLDILLPFASSDIQDLIIDFDKPVNIINLDALHKEISNSTGSYKFEAVVISDTKLKLTSTYIIKKDLIELESLQQLDTLNDAAMEMVNSRIIVNFKSAGSGLTMR